MTHPNRAEVDTVADRLAAWANLNPEKVMTDYGRGTIEVDARTLARLLRLATQHDLDDQAPPSDPLLDLLAEFHLGVVRDGAVSTYHLNDTGALIGLLEQNGVVSPGAYAMPVNDVIHQVNQVNGLEAFVTRSPAELVRWERERPWESDEPWDPRGHTDGDTIDP